MEAEDEEMAAYMARYPDEDWSDELGVRAREYREGWEMYRTGPFFGTFEQTTRIPPMRYTNTDGDVPCAYGHYETIQMFSVKIKETKGGLQWPLHVYGVVAARDPIDHNRNIIFHRQRDNCQILTEGHPYLLLTGPTRAVVVCGFVYFEAVLKVKGSIESEDKELSFVTVPLNGSGESQYTCLKKDEFTSRLSTLEVTFGHVVRSVEATIFVRVANGSWPVGLYGEFTAHTSSLEHNKILLLDSGDEKLPVDVDGMVMLSRRVASVESEGELIVSVAAYGFDDESGRIKVIGKDEEPFNPKMAGKSSGELNVGFCKMEVTVFWSLISLLP